MIRFLWTIILMFIFIRPFISEVTFDFLNITLTSIFNFSACFYILSHKNRPFTAIDKACFIFLLSLFISFPFSTDITNSLIKIWDYLSLILLFYTVRVSDQKQKKQIIIVLMASSLILCLHSLYSLLVASKTTLAYLQKYNINYPFAHEFISRNRAFSPFISPNLLANYLVMIIMISLGLFFSKLKHYYMESHAHTGNIKKLLTLINIGCLAISLVSLFFTKSIGGWLTLAASLLVFVVLIKRVNRKTLLTLLLILTVTFFILAMRFNEKKQYTQLNFSIDKRLSYWQNSWEIIKTHPLVGTGVGDFSLNETKMAHNSYLQIWAEMGLISFLTWLAIVFIFLKNYLNSRLNSNERIFKTALASAAIAFLIHNVFDFSFFVPQAAFVWWLILGLASGT